MKTHVRLKIFFFLSAILFNEVIFSQKAPENNLRKYSAVAEKDAIWNLSHSLDTARDEQIIILLNKIETMSEQLWHRVLTVALEEPRSFLRNYLVLRFLEKLPYYDQSKFIYQDFVLILDSDYNRFIKESMPDESEQEKMVNILKVIGKWNIKEMLYQTSALLAYPLLDVRKAANEAIIIIQDDRIYPIILNLSKSGNPVERIYAIDSLFYIKDDRTIPVLLQLLSDPNKSVRYYAIRSLDAMNSQDAIPYYIRILRSDVNDEVRIITANVLAKIKPPMAFQALLDSLSDGNSLLRKSVLEAINGYANINAAFVISRQLTVEPDNELKIMEIQTLLALANSGMMAGLNKVMKEEPDISVLLWSIYVTGKLVDYNGYDLLLTNLTHANAQVRQEAAIALANFKVKKTVPYLLDLISNEKEPYPVQASAVYALKNIDDNSAIPRMYSLSLTHNNIMIRAEIKEVLKGFLDKRFK